MRKLSVALLLATASLAGFAQSGKVITAFNLYNAYQQSGNKDTKSLEEAYTAINEAAENDNTKGENKTWYYKGFIDQLISLDTVIQSKYPNAIFDAAQAYETVITLSEGPDGKKKFVDDAYSNLAYIVAESHNYGIGLMRNKDDKGAYAAFNETLSVSDFLKKRNQDSKVKVKLDDTRFLAAYVAGHLKKTEEAKALYQQLIANNYKNIGIYTELADIYKTAGDTQKALEVLNNAQKVYPDSANLTIDIINIYLATDRQTEALEYMNKAIQQDPKNATLYFVRAHAYGELKNEEKCVEDYKKAIEVEPKYAEAYNNLGAIYLDKANALVDTMSAPKISDADYQKLDQKRLGYLKEALPYLEKASELKPNDLQYLDVLKTIYAKLGDYDKVSVVKKKMTDLQGQKKGSDTAPNK